MIMHGSPAPIADLLPLAERLAVAHPVLIPELPGFEDADRAMFRAFAAGIRADPSCAQIRPMLPGRSASRWHDWPRAPPSTSCRAVRTRCSSRTRPRRSSASWTS
jgi:hypothetical protein